MTGSLQDFIDSIFERFDAAIEQHNVKLPFRAEDFMLMDTEPNRGQYSFKHYDTRNYVFMTTAGRVIVPRTDRLVGERLPTQLNTSKRLQRNKPFMKGEFCIDESQHLAGNGSWQSHLESVPGED